MNVSYKNSARTEWQLQEAKAMLSDVVKAAGSKPQIITVRGNKAAVILSYEKYRKLTSPKRSFFDFIQNSPLYGAELELPPRISEKARDINL